MLAPPLDDVLRRTDGRLRSPSDIHDLRVACRRLRVGLWLFADLVGRRRRRRLDRGLARIAHALATVRECDVLIESAASDARRRQELEAQRRELLTHARHAVKGRRGRRLRRRLSRLRSRIREEAGFDVEPAPLRIAAAVERRVSRMNECLRKAGTGDPAALHRLRLQVKKLRYCLLLLEGGQDAPTAWASTLATLARAQDRLGDWNDRCVDAARGGPRFSIPRDALGTELSHLARIVVSAPRAPA